MEYSLGLKINVDKTKRRLQDFIEFYGINGVYISYSGGKDSEVLCFLARELYPNIKIVFSNTGMEFPETVSQVLKRRSQGWNIDIVIPKRTFRDVLEKQGYPVISKTTSMAINRYRNAGSKEIADKRLGLIEGCKVGTNENVWEYIEKNNIDISEAYTKHGYKRTGCYGCLYGCYKGADENRMINLKQTHPKLYKFLMDEMNYKEICKELKISV